MRAIFALTFATIKSASRNWFAAGLLVVLGGVVLWLPRHIIGDGTAVGHLTLSLTYCLYFAATILSITTIWLSCQVIGADISGHYIHLLMSKPISVWQYWLSRWLGIVILQGMLLALVSALIYFQIMRQMRAQAFTGDELTTIQQQILTAREVFAPEPDEPPLSSANHGMEMAINPAPSPLRPGGTAHRQPDTVTSSSQLISSHQGKVWRFARLSVNDHPPASLFLRFCLYRDHPEVRGQSATRGLWRIRYPDTRNYLEVPMPEVIPGVFYEINLPATCVSQNGMVEVEYVNHDREDRAVVFQTGAGPFLLRPATGFTENYLRALLPIQMLLMFVAAVGCTAGTLAAPPMAIFFSCSYVVIGMLMVVYRAIYPQLMTDLPNLMAVFLHALSRFHQVVEMTTVAINQYLEIPRLARGELIATSRLVHTAIDLLLVHGVPIAVLGMVCLQRRELGAVVRE